MRIRESNAFLLFLILILFIIAGRIQAKTNQEELQMNQEYESALKEKYEREQDIRWKQPTVTKAPVEEVEAVNLNQQIQEEEFYAECDEIAILTEAEYSPSGTEETFAVKCAIASTILNRVDSDHFPDNVHDVIWQEGQFTPVTQGKMDYIIPSEETYAAVRYVVIEKNRTTEALYFESQGNTSNWHRNNLTLLETIDVMNFYK